MQLRIHHTTTYVYDTPVNYALQRLRLTPKETPAQRILDWTTTVAGAVKELEFHDQHRNLVELVSFHADTLHVRIDSQGTVETTNTNGVTPTHAGHTPLWLFQRQTGLTTAGSQVQDLAAGVCDEGAAPGVDELHHLSDTIADAVEYGSGATTATSTAEEALAAGKGVCQDHAHIFIAAARHLGAPARYVSGYLMMNDRVDQDATHAWAEAWVDGLGWVAFDVSNRICPDERYVRVATGLDYREAAPISGMRLGTSSEALTVAVQVEQQQQ